MQRIDSKGLAPLRLPGLGLALLLAACSGQESSAPAGVSPAGGMAEETGNAPEETGDPERAAMTAAGGAGACANDPGVDYLCGPVNAEDILRLGDSDWLLASGMSGELAGDPSVNGRIHLIDLRERRWEVLFPGDDPAFAHDTAMYPDCPGPLDTGNFSAHGLALRELPGRADSYRLYMTSHGAREAIETFIVDVSGKPTLTWTGCVPMPETSWTNSVAILDDGGFMATQFMDPTRNGIAEVRRGEITGGVFEWHPGRQPALIEGTGLPGPNGIEISADERYLYVAAFGGHEIVRYDLATRPPESSAARVDAEPDNIRRGPDGALYTVGGNYSEVCEDEVCRPGWSIWRIDPETMASEKLKDPGPLPGFGVASSVLPVDGEFWVGTFAGDRMAILPAR